MDSFAAGSVGWIHPDLKRLQNNRNSSALDPQQPDNNFNANLAGVNGGGGCGGRQTPVPATAGLFLAPADPLPPPRYHFNAKREEATAIKNASVDKATITKKQNLAPPPPPPMPPPPLPPTMTTVDGVTNESNIFAVAANRSNNHHGNHQEQNTTLFSHQSQQQQRQDGLHHRHGGAQHNRYHDTKSAEAERVLQHCKGKLFSSQLELELLKARLEEARRLEAQLEAQISKQMTETIEPIEAFTDELQTQLMVRKANMSKVMQHAAALTVPAASPNASGGAIPAIASSCDPNHPLLPLSPADAAAQLNPYWTSIRKSGKAIFRLKAVHGSAAAFPNPDSGVPDNNNNSSANLGSKRDRCDTALDHHHEGGSGGFAFSFPSLSPHCNDGRVGAFKSYIKTFTHQIDRLHLLSVVNNVLVTGGGDGTMAPETWICRKTSSSSTLSPSSESKKGASTFSRMLRVGGTPQTALAHMLNGTHILTILQKLTDELCGTQESLSLLQETVEEVFNAKEERKEMRRRRRLAAQQSRRAMMGKEAEGGVLGSPSQFYANTNPTIPSTTATTTTAGPFFAAPFPHPSTTGDALFTSILGDAMATLPHHQQQQQHASAYQSSAAANMMGGQHLGGGKSIGVKSFAGLNDDATANVINTAAARTPPSPPSSHHSGEKDQNSKREESDREGEEEGACSSVRLAQQQQRIQTNLTSIYVIPNTLCGNAQNVSSCKEEGGEGEENSSFDSVRTFLKEMCPMLEVAEIPATKGGEGAADSRKNAPAFLLLRPVIVPPTTPMCLLSSHAPTSSNSSSNGKKAKDTHNKSDDGNVELGLGLGADSRATFCTNPACPFQHRCQGAFVSLVTQIAMLRLKASHKDRRSARLKLLKRHASSLASSSPAPMGCSPSSSPTTSTSASVGGGADALPFISPIFEILFFLNQHVGDCFAALSLEARALSVNVLSRIVTKARKCCRRRAAHDDDDDDGSEKKKKQSRDNTFGGHFDEDDKDEDYSEYEEGVGTDFKQSGADMKRNRTEENAFIYHGNEEQHEDCEENDDFDDDDDDDDEDDASFVADVALAAEQWSQWLFAFQHALSVAAQLWQAALIAEVIKRGYHQVPDVETENEQQVDIKIPTTSTAAATKQSSKNKGQSNLPMTTANPQQKQQQQPIRVIKVKPVEAAMQQLFELRRTQVASSSTVMAAVVNRGGEGRDDAKKGERRGGGEIRSPAWAALHPQCVFANDLQTLSGDVSSSSSSSSHLLLLQQTKPSRFQITFSRLWRKLVDGEDQQDIEDDERDEGKHDNNHNGEEESDDDYNLHFSFRSQRKEGEDDEDDVHNDGESGDEEVTRNDLVKLCMDELKAIATETLQLQQQGRRTEGEECPKRTDDDEDQQQQLAKSSGKIKSAQVATLHAREEVVWRALILITQTFPAFELAALTALFEKEQQREQLLSLSSHDNGDDGYLKQQQQHGGNTEDFTKIADADQKEREKEAQSHRRISALYRDETSLFNTAIARCPHCPSLYLERCEWYWRNEVIDYSSSSPSSASLWGTQQTSSFASSSQFSSLPCHSRQHILAATRIVKDTLKAFATICASLLLIIVDRQGHTDEDDNPIDAADGKKGETPSTGKGGRRNNFSSRVKADIKLFARLGTVIALRHLQYCALQAFHHSGGNAAFDNSGCHATSGDCFSNFTLGDFVAITGDMLGSSSDDTESQTASSSSSPHRQQPHHHPLAFLGDVALFNIAVFSQQLTLLLSTHVSLSTALAEQKRRRAEKQQLEDNLHDIHGGAHIFDDDEHRQERKRECEALLFKQEEEASKLLASVRQLLLVMCGVDASSLSSASSSSSSGPSSEKLSKKSVIAALDGTEFLSAVVSKNCKMGTKAKQTTAGKNATGDNTNNNSCSSSSANTNAKKITFATPIASLLPAAHEVPLEWIGHAGVASVLKNLASVAQITERHRKRLFDTQTTHISTQHHSILPPFASTSHPHKYKHNVFVIGENVLAAVQHCVLAVTKAVAVPTIRHVLSKSGMVTDMKRNTTINASDRDDDDRSMNLSPSNTTVSSPSSSSSSPIAQLLALHCNALLLFFEEASISSVVCSSDSRAPALLLSTRQLADVRSVLSKAISVGSGGGSYDGAHDEAAFSFGGPLLSAIVPFLISPSHHQSEKFSAADAHQQQPQNKNKTSSMPSTTMPLSVHYWESVVSVVDAYGSMFDVSSRWKGGDNRGALSSSKIGLSSAQLLDFGRATIGDTVVDGNDESGVGGNNPLRSLLTSSRRPSLVLAEALLKHIALYEGPMLLKQINKTKHHINNHGATAKKEKKAFDREGGGGENDVANSTQAEAPDAFESMKRAEAVAMLTAVNAPSVARQHRQAVELCVQRLREAVCLVHWLREIVADASIVHGDFDNFDDEKCCRTKSATLNAATDFSEGALEKIRELSSQLSHHDHDDPPIPSQCMITSMLMNAKPPCLSLQRRALLKELVQQTSCSGGVNCNNFGDNRASLIEGKSSFIKTLKRQVTSMASAQEVEHEAGGLFSTLFASASPSALAWIAYASQDAVTYPIYALCSHHHNHARHLPSSSQACVGSASIDDEALFAERVMRLAARL